jgi:hypothetical protein
MAQRRWFHMSTSTFRAALPAAERLHSEQHPGEDLRVLWSADSTSCLVCLDGASKEWRAAQPWVSQCLGIYSRDDWPGPARVVGVRGRLAAAAASLAEALSGDERRPVWDEDDAWNA